MHLEPRDDVVPRVKWTAFVGGSWLPWSGNIIEVENPAIGQVIALAAESPSCVVDHAVDVAAVSQQNWARLSPRERGKFLRAVAAVFLEHADELATLECLENGKSLRDARAFDINYAIATFELFAGLVETLHGDLLNQGPIEARIYPEPYGVIGAILPFNWPPIHFAAKVAPAIAAGNTIIVKPGEQAPLTVLRMTELANTVLPKGVVNAVPGIEAGVRLVEHPGIGRLSFTGSLETGRKVLAGAAPNLTPATMELGGKNALIIFPDADVKKTIEAAIEGLYFNQGEACTSTSRILLHESIYDLYAELLARVTRGLQVGDGMAEDTDIGPMVNASQRDRVMRYLAIAQEEGAEVLAEAELPSDPRLKNGYWVPPTVLGSVTTGMRIAQEEIFGPVATLMKFRDEGEALSIANGTPFGLTAAVFTGDLVRADRVARGLHAGMVFVNNYHRTSLLGSPFGGIKASGYGREGALETLREFVRSKNIRWVSGRQALPYWAPARRLVSGLVLK